MDLKPEVTRFQRPIRLVEIEEERPLLFVGSSSEAREHHILDAFVSSLSEYAKVVPWTIAPQFKKQGLQTTLPALIKAADEYDFAVFVLTPDDKILHRDKEFMCPRDNVVFEMGLFVSTIGPERVFAAQKNNSGSSIQLQIPTDLLGVNMPSFHHPTNIEDANSIHSATRGFVEQICELQFRQIDLPLVNRWGFDEKTRKFNIRLSAPKLTRSRDTIGNKSICVAARPVDDHVDIADDEHIVFSSLKKPRFPINRDVPFVVLEEDFHRKIDEQDTIEARILLVPPETNPSEYNTIGELIKKRCLVVESVSFTTSEGQKKSASELSSDSK